MNQHTLAVSGSQVLSLFISLQGVATLALESPYYGGRRPAGQRGAKLRAVSDLLTLGWATICESLHLLHWMDKEGFKDKGQWGETGLWCRHSSWQGLRGSLAAAGS